MVVLYTPETGYFLLKQFVPVAVINAVNAFSYLE